MWSTKQRLNTTQLLLSTPWTAKERLLMALLLNSYFCLWELAFLFPSSNDVYHNLLHIMWYVSIHLTVHVFPVKWPSRPCSHSWNTCQAHCGMCCSRKCLQLKSHIGIFHTYISYHISISISLILPKTIHYFPQNNSGHKHISTTHTPLPCYSVLEIFNLSNTWRGLCDSTCQGFKTY